MEIEDIYICKSKASVHILVYLGILTIINILVWDKAELGAFLVNWSCLIQNHSWMHEMSIKKDEAMTEMTCDLLYQNIRYSTSAYFMKNHGTTACKIFKSVLYVCLSSSFFPQLLICRQYEFEQIALWYQFLYICTCIYT